MKARSLWESQRPAASDQGVDEVAVSLEGAAGNALLGAGHDEAHFVFCSVHRSRGIAHCVLSAQVEGERGRF